MHLDKKLSSISQQFPFFPNTRQGTRRFFQQRLTMSVCECDERYLGLPTFAWRNKKAFFSEIKEKALEFDVSMARKTSLYWWQGNSVKDSGSVCPNLCDDLFSNAFYTVFGT